MGAPILAAYRSFPERLLSVPSLATSQRQITLEQLHQLDTPVVILGTVGETQSGKSTFLQHALDRPPDTEKTTRIEVRIIPVPNAVPQMFCALVDADGRQLSQQFDVCDHVDLLFVFLDHNSSDRNAALSRQRLSSHDSFLFQLRSRLTREGGKMPHHIHFVLNKRDLWEPDIGIREFLGSWFCEIIEAWRNYGMASQITSSHHSNWDAHDVRSMLRIIKESVPD